MESRLILLAIIINSICFITSLIYYRFKSYYNGSIFLQEDDELWMAGSMLIFGPFLPLTLLAIKLLAYLISIVDKNIAKVAERLNARRDKKYYFGVWQMKGGKNKYLGLYVKNVTTYGWSTSDTTKCVYFVERNGTINYVNVENIELEEE